MRTARWIAALVGAFALAFPSLEATAATPAMTIVMRDLNNPRGLAFGSNGALYVAEAGRGGTQPCFVGPEGQEFAGATGAVSRLWHGAQQRIVTGLPSHAAAGGFGALGPHDVLPRGGGRIDVTIGLGTDPAQRSLCAPIGKDFGWLVRAQANGDWRRSVDIAAYEAHANPDGGAIDSDPYGLLAGANGRRQDDANEDEQSGSEDEQDGDNGRNGQGASTIATDAGGNSLLAIRSNGAISTLAVFPSRSTGRATDSVPTTVARGPDGALYVGELTGFPFATGDANVYRVVPGSTTPVVFRSGFTAIIDIAFGRDGSLYVLEFATGPGLTGPGDLVRVTPSGTRTVVATGFVAPSSVAIGPDAAFYVSNCGVFPAGGAPPCTAGGGGHVLRFKP
jgi:hypothetical protein